MAKQYYSVLTTYGAQLFAQAMANKRPVTITHMAVGDGNGKSIQPDSTRTTLFREVHRATVSAVSTDPRNNKQVIFELTIPETIGGFYVREIGIFDATGKLVAMANCPETYKPRLDEGSGKVQVLRMILLVSSSDAVTITVDDTVIFATRGQLTPKTLTATTTNSIDDSGHTHEIAKASTTQAGLVQLVDNLTSADNSKALTAAQGKVLNDKLDNTQIGGRNLLIGSRLIRNKEGTDYYSLPQNVDYAAIRHLVLSADFDVVNFKRVETPNATTRIGLEIKLDYTDGTNQYVGLWKENRSTTQAISAQGRLSYLFNVPANKIIARISSATTQIRAATADKMVVSYPKVEIGNKATDWSHAPEDRDFIKIVQNSTPVTLNLANKAALTAYLDQLGNGVLQQAHYQFVLANNSTDNISGLPLADKVPVQLDLSVRSGVSILSCHYLNNNRKFSALVDFNKTDYSLNWQEELKMTDGWVKTPLRVENTIEGGSYLTLKRNNASDLTAPAMILDNQAADINQTLPRDVILGEQRFLANGKTRISWRGVLRQDKSTFLAAILKDAAGSDKYALFLSSSGAVGINGGTGNNTTDKLVINGTASANAPPNEANNGQLVTSAWVRRNFLPRTVTGTRELIFDNGNQPIYRVNNLDGSWWQLNFSNPENNRSFQFTNVIPGDPYRYLTVTFPAYDKNEIVAYQSYVNNQVTNAKNWATGAFLAKTVESSLVHVKGNETITGEKTFHYHVKLRSNADNSKLGRIGQNSNDLFIQNGYSGKYLQLKNTGELRYNDNLIHDDSMPYVKMTVKDSAYGGIDISRSGTAGSWLSRIEALPDKRWKFYVQNSHDIYLPVKSGTVVLDSDCSNAGGANKVVKTDGSGDVIGRLFRATYQDEARIQGAIAFRVNNSNDNYTRYCNSPSAVRTWLGLHESATRAANWEEVSGKPSTFTPSTHNHPWNQVTGIPATATRWPTWSEVTNKPTLVQDIRLGATVQRKLEDAAWETHGAGYVVTGFHNVSADLNTNDYVYVKPIQKYINGAWVTIANA